jgi:intracellular sulfur oxidation DsrE/DsrF family protein
LLAIGIGGGWAVNAWRMADAGAPLQDIAQVNPAAPGASRMIVHLSSLDPARVEGALDTVERLLSESHARGEPVQLEVIANAEGLGLLRRGSPYAERIHSLTTRYDNVAFLACGIAMETARLSEHAEVKLIPEAQRVPAALDQILTRLKHGWTYVRG